MPIEEALEIVRQVEAREDRCNGNMRGRVVHEAFETVFRAVESILIPEIKTQ